MVKSDPIRESAKPLTEQCFTAKYAREHVGYSVSGDAISSDVLCVGAYLYCLSLMRSGW